MAQVKVKEAVDEQAPSEKLRRSHWWIQREVPRVMYGDEFLRVVREHLHPRFNFGHVRSNRFGAQSRRAAGMITAGTIFCTNPAGMFDVMSVPANEIPYSTRRPSLDDWDEEFGRFKGQSQIVPGWRKILADLVGAAALSPSDELSRLMGQDSFQKQPGRYRV